MRILFFSDTHLGLDWPKQPRIQRRRRGPDLLANYTHILNCAGGLNVDAIIHGGDVFHRSRPAQHVIRHFYEPLLPLLDGGLPVLVVPGNHERSQLPDHPLRYHPNLHIFETARSMVLPGEPSIAVGGIPNQRHDFAPNFQSLLQKTKLLEQRADFHILVMHQAVEGAVVGRRPYRFPADQNTLAQQAIPKALDLVLAGHIHRAQTILTPQGVPVYFSGSTERISLAEQLETKGYLILEVSAEGIAPTFHPLPSRPMREVHVPLHVDASETLEAYLRRQGELLPRDAVLYVKYASTQQAQLLPAEAIRAALPATLNVELRPPRQHKARD